MKKYYLIVFLLISFSVQNFYAQITREVDFVNDPFVSEEQDPNAVNTLEGTIITSHHAEVPVNLDLTLNPSGSGNGGGGSGGGGGGTSSSGGGGGGPSPTPTCEITCNDPNLVVDTSSCSCIPKPGPPCEITSCTKNQILILDICKCIDCPSHTNRSEDTNKGFFIQKRTPPGARFPKSFLKGTFAIPPFPGISQADLTQISNKSQAIFRNNNINADLELKFSSNPRISGGGQVAVTFINKTVVGIPRTLPNGTPGYSYIIRAGETTGHNTKPGTTIEIVRKVKVNDLLMK